MYETLIVEEKDYILYVGLNRPECRNAFNPQMIEDLTNFFLTANKSSARAIYLYGQGKAFCSGADLNWMKSMKDFSEEENIQDALQLFNMFKAGLSCKLPIIGHFHKYVMGGAIGLASICDIALAETDTNFCFSEVLLGLAPAVISPFVLNKMQKSFVRQYTLTGEQFSENIAMKSGLIQFCGSKQEVKDYAKILFTQFKKAEPNAVKKTKKLLQHIQNINELEDIKYEAARIIASLRVSKEGQEGLEAFFNQSIPEWKIIEE
ncbi:MAG: enoyl-CoA hydratase [Bdellovibrionales bacterium]|nr:enoyl-CoA hydratase [Bdellovibrionales bacterium]